MSYAELAARATRDVFLHLGVAAVFAPLTGASIATRAILDRETLVQGELGQVLDPRPSVELMRADIGDARQGKLTIAGVDWTLDRLIEDDGDVVRFFVK